jgi:hypothetical protein
MRGCGKIEKFKKRMAAVLAVLMMSGGFGTTAFADEVASEAHGQAAGNGNLVTIEDELVPIADVPQTGDALPLWLGTSLMTGLVFAALGWRKRED